jgi:hypothetical protein
MTQSLLHPPLWLLGTILVCAVGLFWQANQRGEKRLLWAGIVVAVLLLSWGLVDWFAVTDLDRATNRTRQIAAAVDRQDWPALGGLLDPTTTLEVFHNRDQILQGAQHTAQNIGLKEVRITSLTAEDRGNLIAVTIRCFSTQDAVPQPVPTDWQFSYAKTSDGLVLEQIEPLDGGQVSSEQIRSQLVR